MLNTLGLLAWVYPGLILGCFSPVSIFSLATLQGNYIRGHRKAFGLEMPKNPLYLGEITHILLSW